MGARLLFGTLLLGGTVLFQLKSLDRPEHSTDVFIFWLIGATYSLSLIYSLLFPKIRQTHYFVTSQLTIDLVIISSLVLVTGAQDSIFLFCYLLVIIGAAILLYRQGALLFATGSLVFLGLLLFLTRIGFFQNLPILHPSSKLSLAEFSYILLVYGLSFFVIALLASHLSEQLRDTGEMLKQQQIDFDDLEALHQDIVRSLTSGLITTDMEGYIQFFNQSACKQTGLMWSSLFGKHISEVFVDLPEEVIESPQQYGRFEHEFRCSSGEKKVFGCSLVPLHNRNKKQNGALLLFQDLTHLKYMENKSRESEKLAALGTMAAGMAHEIRNPLSAISGSIQLLRDDLNPSKEHETLMDIVLKEAERLNMLLGDFLLFARPKSLNRNNYDVEALFQETLYLFTQDPNFQDVEVHLEIEEDCQIEVDSQLFHQATWNLLVNAAQAMANNTTPKEITITASNGTGGCTISVADQGKGIDKESQSRIFEPFFSTKDQGTGLGLAVVQRIASEHGGSVEVASVEPQGTCFQLFFPFSQDKPEEKKAT